MGGLKRHRKTMKSDKNVIDLLMSSWQMGQNSNIYTIFSHFIILCCNIMKCSASTLALHSVLYIKCSLFANYAIYYTTWEKESEGGC